MNVFKKNVVRFTSEMMVIIKKEKYSKRLELSEFTVKDYKKALPMLEDVFDEIQQTRPKNKRVELLIELLCDIVCGIPSGILEKYEVGEHNYQGKFTNNKKAYLCMKLVLCYIKEYKLKDKIQDENIYMNCISLIENGYYRSKEDRNDLCIWGIIDTEEEEDEDEYDDEDEYEYEYEDEDEYEDEEEEVEYATLAQWKAYLDEYVVGQEEGKKALSLQLYHYLEKDISAPSLLIGDTGSGKNHIIDTISACPFINDRVPVITYDCSNLTPNGFTGESVRDIIKLYKKVLSESVLLQNHCIIYLDEFSKIVMPNHDSHGENANALTQYQLMGLLSGTKIEDVDTSKILFILGGCFEDLNELREERRKKKKSVGFALEDTFDKSKEQWVSLREDLLTIQMKREMLGRIQTIIELEKLDKVQMKKIMLHGKVGPLAKRIKEFEIDGLELVIEDEVVDYLVEKAVTEDLGARSAGNVLQEMLGTYQFDMITGGFDRMIVHKGMFANNERPRMERRILNNQE